MLDTYVYCAQYPAAGQAWPYFTWGRIERVEPALQPAGSSSSLPPWRAESVETGLEKPVVAVTATVHDIQGTRVDIVKDEKVVA
jgi:hypothetical protein